MIKIFVAGDIVIGRKLSNAFKAISEIIDNVEADLHFGNLEIPLTKRGTSSPKITAWRSSPAVADYLKKTGFDVLSTANNHALDYGIEGLADTLEAVRGAGIQTVGSGVNIEEALAPAFIEKGSERLAFLAVACTLPLGSDAATHRAGVAPIHVRTSYEYDPLDIQEEPGCIPTYIHTSANAVDVNLICERIHGLKADGYTVIMSLHWGCAYQKKLAQYQPVLAASLAEAGCDIIVGHHPHTIHGINVIDRMPVLYSLGNFVMDETAEGRTDRVFLSGMAISWDPWPDSLVAIIDIENGKIIQVDVLPIVLDDGGLPGWPDEQTQTRTLLDTIKLSGGSIPYGQLKKNRITIKLK